MDEKDFNGRDYDRMYKIVMNFLHKRGAEDGIPAINVGGQS